MNILFLIFHGLETASGISKKIKNQIKGLEALGHTVSLCHYEIKTDGRRIRMIDDEVLEDYGNSPLAPMRKRISYNAIVTYARTHRIQFVYVRSFHNANPFTIRLFRNLRKAGIQVVLEIPTFPYDQEYRHLPWRWKAEHLIDRCFRHSLAHHTDSIVTFSDASRIFGQHTIRISNGVDFDNLPLQPAHPHPYKELHLIGVAEIHYWHGYDRIIAGLGEYYRLQPHRRVYLHLVGGIGQAETHLFRTLIDNYRLGDYVKLYGQQQGEELDRIFRQCHFAIGSLGRHRSGIDKIKTLKNREYAARGIPFIYSETDTDFDRMPYILKAPADDSPIVIQDILNFNDTLSLTPGEIRHSIARLSWQVQMQKVIDQLYCEKI